jgi:hypothetical protein
MSRESVTFYLQTADKTRKAQITVARNMRVEEIIKASTKKWYLSFGRDYQLMNMTTGKVLLPGLLLTADNVQNGDTLMVQPFPTHG